MRLIELPSKKVRIFTQRKRKSAENVYRHEDRERRRTMTKARQHLPGQVALLTRRTEERRYFLRPDTQSRRMVEYELASASVEANLGIHALMTMSNHPHIIATDRQGERSDFMRDFCSGIARARNRHLDRKGHFWDTQQFGDTVLLDRQAIEDKLLYTWLNPVVAGLVARAEHWPGAKILPRDWGKTRTVTAPQDGFYNQKAARTIEFTPMPPPGYDDMTLEEVIEHFETLLREAEDRLRARRRRSGKRVPQLRHLLQLNPFDAPRTRASSGKLNPRFASRNPALMARAQAERRQFLSDYDKANETLRKGTGNAVFPPGTIRLRKIANVDCHDLVGCECTVFAA